MAESKIEQAKKGRISMKYRELGNTGSKVSEIGIGMAKRMKKILAVDDEQDIRTLLKEYLELEGYLV